MFRLFLYTLPLSSFLHSWLFLIYAFHILVQIAFKTKALEGYIANIIGYLTLCYMPRQHLFGVYPY